MASTRNRSLTLSAAEEQSLAARCPVLEAALGCRPPASCEPGGDLDGQLLLQDALMALPLLPSGVADLVVLDPPYNLDKDFHGVNFRARSLPEYADWLLSWLPEVIRILRPGGSLYFCADWRSSTAFHLVAAEQLDIRNRITWAREKGRGAARNWKSIAEDIWFCTKGDDFYFDVAAVKLRRPVVAPYRTSDGSSKDWVDNPDGAYRDTHPGNIWTDLTVPFWSMPENTDHPTQKPEKLIAKLILASSRPGDLVFDPFAGSGTSLVVAKKLGRRFLGIECNPHYAALSLKRLELAETRPQIQGYEAGVFLERNPGRSGRPAKVN